MRDIIIAMLKVIKWIFKLILIAVVIIVGINLFVKFEGERSLRSLDQIRGQSYDCIIVLGAGVYGNGEPTKILKDRLDRGIELYNAGVAPKLLLSGDNGKTNYDEVKVMKNYCLKHGIPAKDIFLDHAGFSTYEIDVSRKGYIRCKVSSSGYTALSRGEIAIYSKRLGIKAVGVSAAEKKYDGDEARAIREFLSREKLLCSAL